MRRTISTHYDLWMMKDKYDGDTAPTKKSAADRTSNEGGRHHTTSTSTKRATTSSNTTTTRATVDTRHMHAATGNEQRGGGGRGRGDAEVIGDDTNFDADTFYAHRFEERTVLGERGHGGEGDQRLQEEQMWTCDGLAGELWPELIATDTPWSVAITWSFNTRLENLSPTSAHAAAMMSNSMHNFLARRACHAHSNPEFIVGGPMALFRCRLITGRVRPSSIQIYPADIEPARESKVPLDDPASDRRKHDTVPAAQPEPNPCVFCFRKGHQCAESTTTIPQGICQIDFARAYDSARRGGPRQHRDVPAQEIGRYIRDLQNSKSSFQHAGWRTTPVRQGVGLRHGGSMIPVLLSAVPFEPRTSGCGRSAQKRGVVTVGGAVRPCGEPRAPRSSTSGSDAPPIRCGLF